MSEQFILKSLERIEGKIDGAVSDLSATRATIGEFKKTTEKNITSLWDKYEEIQELKPKLENHVSGHPSAVKILGISAGATTTILGIIKLAEYVYK